MTHEKMTLLLAQGPSVSPGVSHPRFPLIRTLRKVYGQNFAAGYPETEKLSEVLLILNETSLSQLRRDYETGHLDHKITNASK